MLILKLFLSLAHITEAFEKFSILSKVKKGLYLPWIRSQLKSPDKWGLREEAVQ
jgi:hypothetical protein